MRRLFYILLIGLLPMLCFSQDYSTEQTGVMMKMASLRAALLGKDSVALSKLLADDVTYGHTNGMVQTKAQLIRDVVSGTQHYKSIDPADMKIRVYGNTAIVNMKAKVSLVFSGSDLDLNMAIVLVWVKKDNDWKLEARQSVKI